MTTCMNAYFRMELTALVMIITAMSISSFVVFRPVVSRRVPLAQSRGDPHGLEYMGDFHGVGMTGSTG